MAPSGQKWRRTIVYIVVFHIWMDIHGLHSSAAHYANQTLQTLCQAQCEALWVDQAHGCDTESSEDRYWVSQCEEPVCEGTCSVLSNSFKANQDKLPGRPNVTIALAGGRKVELSWQDCDKFANLTTIYIIEQASPISTLPNFNQYKIIGWVRNNHYRIDGLESCSSNSYRVMAINRYGSLGFSASTKALALQPGYITNIRYVGAGVYFYSDPDPTQSLFMSILQWDAPQGWDESEIKTYEWNHMTPHRHCQDVYNDVLPLFHRMENQTNHRLLTVGARAIGCTFNIQVRAISKCNVTGPWTDFTVDLTDCSKIIGYKCQEGEFNPPGQVQNVSLSIVATPWAVIKQYYDKPYFNSPLLVNLKITWDPPTDLGSENSIENYIIRSGKVQRYLYPIPPTFLGSINVKRVSRNIGGVTFQLPVYDAPYDYSVQVVATAPGQKIQGNEWDMFPMYTITVERNDSLASLKQNGKILLDEAGLVIVYINNTLPVSFVLESPLGKAGNLSVDRYALQWGPLVGPNSNEIFIENRTIVPMSPIIFDDGSQPLHINKPG